MIRAACVGAILLGLLSFGKAHAQPSRAPAPDAPVDTSTDTSTDTSESPVGAELSFDSGFSLDAAAAYKELVRHRFQLNIGTVLDVGLALAGFAGARQALPELWRVLRDDPMLRAAFANLALQYKPRLDYAGYAGTVAQSTRYVGLALGFEADVTAPLCRYVGGAFNGQLFADKEGEGIAYDSRVTGCLPWGPFSLELGFTSQKSVRMGLAAAPLAPARRIDSLGFLLKIRGFRWLDKAWEVVTLPTDVNFVDVAPASDDGYESASFSIDASFVRYSRYGVGTAGQDRVLDFIPVRVLGEQDAQGAMRSATVVDVGAVRVTGANLGGGLFLDAHAGLQNATIGPTTAGAPRDETVITGSIDSELHWVDGPMRSSLRYQRGLLPDAEFRLLLEDRGTLGVSRQLSDMLTLGSSLFAAYTRTATTPPMVPALKAAATYGARLDLGYAVRGPLYLTVSGEAARSYYAGDNTLVLPEPANELRVTAGLAATFSSALNR